MADYNIITHAALGSVFLNADNEYSQTMVKDQS